MFQGKLDMLNASDYCARLKNAYIDSRDALAVIKSLDSPQSLFYLDPPYAGTYNDYAGVPKW